MAKSKTFVHVLKLKPNVQYYFPTNVAVVVDLDGTVYPGIESIIGHKTVKEIEIIS